ncbi:putative gamma-glutamylcyclotransferase At3g02910 [Lotus japonicus]|uniref:putative gamma-glutamylcyclotransferase At3g02910 n=1 Tax=Lotus japonicus TaxID=34305 RepID=UPI00258DB01A|nr:putative gamma-glutamylcyclotransferase At3g02910 [Lotus japonicus]
MVAGRDIAVNAVIDAGDRALIFTYGTLKRNFSNHPLLQDLMRTGDATFIGPYRTAANYPLVCGPYKVPFLLNLPGSGQPVHGELYSVSARGLARMDDLEGIDRNHYERLPIRLLPAGGEEVAAAEAEVEAYFAHRSYAMEMWKKNGKRGLRCYSEKETIGYVKRKDRPQNLTFLDHIRNFLSD